MLKGIIRWYSKYSCRKLAKDEVNSRDRPELDGEATRQTVKKTEESEKQKETSFNSIFDSIGVTTGWLFWLERVVGFA